MRLFVLALWLAIAQTTECPWLLGTTDQDGKFKCKDGTFCTVDSGNLGGDNDPAWACCNGKGSERAQCPQDLPFMCDAPKKCANHLEYCCETEAAKCDRDNKGGERYCVPRGRKFMLYTYLGCDYDLAGEDCHSQLFKQESPSEDWEPVIEQEYGHKRGFKYLREDLLIGWDTQYLFTINPLDSKPKWKILNDGLVFTKIRHVSVVRPNHVFVVATRSSSQDKNGHKHTVFHFNADKEPKDSLVREYWDSLKESTAVDGVHLIAGIHGEQFAVLERELEFSEIDYRAEETGRVNIILCSLNVDDAVSDYYQDSALRAEDCSQLATLSNTYSVDMDYSPETKKLYVLSYDRTGQPANNELGLHKDRNHVQSVDIATGHVQTVINNQEQWSDTFYDMGFEVGYSRIYMVGGILIPSVINIFDLDGNFLGHEPQYFPFHPCYDYVQSNIVSLATGNAAVPLEKEADHIAYDLPPAKEELVNDPIMEYDLVKHEMGVAGHLKPGKATKCHLASEKALELLRQKEDSLSDARAQWELTHDLPVGQRILYTSGDGFVHYGEVIGTNPDGTFNLQLDDGTDGNNIKKSKIARVEFTGPDGGTVTIVVVICALLAVGGFVLWWWLRRKGMDSDAKYGGAAMSTVTPESRAAQEDEIMLGTDYAPPSGDDPTPLNAVYKEPDEDDDGDVPIVSTQL